MDNDESHERNRCNMDNHNLGDYMALDWGSGVSGAASGASVGSMAGPWGAAAGGVIGGALGLFGGSGGKKKKKKVKPISTLDPMQQQLYQQYVDSLSGKGQFSDLYNWDAQGANKNFDANVSRPAYRNFNENIIPGITGQFRSNNLMNSSYTGEALGRAGRNVQESLDAQRSNMQFQGQQSAQDAKRNSINNILNLQTQAFQQPGAPQQNGIDSILSQLAPMGGEYMADFFKKGSANGGIAQGQSGINPATSSAVRF